MTTENVAPDWESFGRAVMECWPEGDVDGGHLQELAEKHGVIRSVPGGYDPEKHGECVECDPGDPFFEVNYDNADEVARLDAGRL